VLAGERAAVHPVGRDTVVQYLREGDRPREDGGGRRGIAADGGQPPVVGVVDAVLAGDGAHTGTPVQTTVAAAS
jgi:hypothetical protein